MFSAGYQTYYVITLLRVDSITMKEGLRRSPKSFNDYTVAIVCAAGFEMSAVRYMLDLEHPNLPTKKGDSNIYVLGQLSGHNVVLACLPGDQGKGSAAIVATNISRMFRSIEWRFLVGVGGGVPSDNHDIRLGDVVVSLPEGQYGGVVQYDLGRDTDDGFTLKGFLSPPPRLLRSAAVKMQSDHLLSNNKVEEFVSAMIQKGLRLKSYQRPPTTTDVLFEADYQHNPRSSSTCDMCDLQKSVHRPCREFEGPEIHYGLIASGDRVMRSAVKRNETISRIGDILCFEMEAAGLMTAFSCIVIRGISNYADSHKNDAWQKYAAATAAACTKELLSYLDPQRVAVSVPSVPSAGTALDNDSKPTARHVFHGKGIQHFGSGSLSVGRDIRIG